ncbi:LA_0442/LA_0875 N-terminal domain-containing protein [Leptospira idonii]|uniref:LA_0442/LA_0875 N-terminal domain-containing protein n=1 Tax=Leptospira idonii TaxID=1193500 RepID=UPI001FEA1AC1|nr:hypothetical protein [Leptospira idonii]
MKNQIKILSLLLCLFLSFPLLAVHTILLKKGKTIKGQVTNQNLETVEITSTDGKHLVIPKKSVLKILYKDLAEADEVKIRKEEENKRETERAKLLEARKQELAVLKETERAKEDELKNKEKTSSVGQGSSSLRSSFLLASPEAGRPVVLASFGDKCQPHSEYPEYFWLFGAFRFKEPPLSSVLPKENHPVRISQVSTWSDIAITLLGGFLVTVTRKTLVVEVCEGSGLRLLSEKELSTLKEEAISEIKNKHELDALEEKVDLELLEKDLEELDKKGR